MVARQREMTWNSVVWSWCLLEAGWGLKKENDHETSIFSLVYMWRFIFNHLQIQTTYSCFEKFKMKAKKKKKIKKKRWKRRIYTTKQNSARNRISTHFETDGEDDVLLNYLVRLNWRQKLFIIKSFHFSERRVLPTDEHKQLMTAFGHCIKELYWSKSMDHISILTAALERTPNWGRCGGIFSDPNCFPRISLHGILVPVKYEHGLLVTHRATFAFASIVSSPTNSL